MRAPRPALLTFSTGSGGGLEPGDVEDRQHQCADAEEPHGEGQENRPCEVFPGRMESPEDPWNSDKRQNPHRAHHLVHQEGGRAGDLRNPPDTNGGVDVRCEEQEAQQDEEHPGPGRLQNDQGEREAEGDGVENQDDPRAGSEVTLKSLVRRVRPAEARLDVEEDSNQEQSDQCGGNLSHVEEEGVRDLPHRFEAYSDLSLELMDIVYTSGSLSGRENR